MFAVVDLGKAVGRLLTPQPCPIAHTLLSARPRRRLMQPAASTPGQSPSWIEGSTLSQKPECGDGLIFYTHTLCPYAQRVHLTLLEKGLDFQLVHVDLSNKPSWFLGLGSGGLVPLVEYQGSIYSESLDICRWLNEQFEGPQLLPADENQRQAALGMVTRGANRFASAGLSLLAGRNGRSWGISKSHTKAQRDAFKAEVAQLDDLLQHSGGPFLLGPDVSLVDLAYHPFAERFDVGAREFCEYDMSEAHGGRIGRWLAAVRGRKYALPSPSADQELLRKALVKHQSLDFFDYATYVAAELHPHAGPCQSFDEG